MKSQLFRVLARSPVRVQRIQPPPTHFLSFLLSAIILTVVILEPTLFHSPSAALTPGEAQGVVAQTSCYGVYHIVRAGQSIYSIASAYGTTAYRIASCNRLSSYTVYAGQSLLVPTYRTPRR